MTRIMEAIMPHYYIDDTLHEAKSISGGLNWLVIYHFFEPVNND